MSQPYSKWQCGIAGHKCCSSGPAFNLRFYFFISFLILSSPPSSSSSQMEVLVGLKDHGVGQTVVQTHYSDEGKVRGRHEIAKVTTTVRAMN